VEIDKQLEDSLGAITVETYGQLKDIMAEENKGAKIVNVKIDPEFESIVLMKA